MTATQQQRITTFLGICRIPSHASKVKRIDTQCADFTRCFSGIPRLLPDNNPIITRCFSEILNIPPIFARHFPDVFPIFPNVCTAVLRAHSTSSVVDMMAAGVLLIDALSSGLLGIASHLPDYLNIAGQVEFTVTFLHALMLLGECSMLSGNTTFIARVLDCDKK